MSILLVLLAGVTFFLWAAIGSSRWGSRLAAPVVFVLLSLGVTTTLAFTPHLPVAMGWVVLAELAALIAVGTALVVRHPTLRRRPSGDSLAVWIPASIGAVLWIATRIAATFVPGASAVSWAMEGDATNNLNYARRIIADNGFKVGSTENPVPLPAGSVALLLSFENNPASAGSMLETELAHYSWLWVVVLAVSCIVMGVVAGSIIDPGKRHLVAIASGLGSLLPLTWFVSGLPIDFGYFNVPITVIFALTAWLIFLAAPRAPRVALVALVVVATLLLVIWTPVALVAVALGFYLAIRERRAVLAARTWRLGAAALAIIVGLVWSATLTIPTYLEQSLALSSGGQGFPPPWQAALAIVGSVLVTAALMRTRTTTPVLGGVLCLVAALYSAVALFLLLSADVFDPWTAYYPVKVAWLACVILLPVALSLLAALWSVAEVRSLAAAGVACTGIVVVASASFAPVNAVVGFPSYQPSERILAGHVWKTGDAAVSVVVAVADASANSDETPILWDSSSPDEQMINFWTLYSVGDQEPGDRALRRFAFREYGAFRSDNERGPASFNVLCELLRDPDRSIVIYTDDPATEADFDARCTGSSARYVVGKTPGID